jgi:tetratricopeptide (TPR) repeat protein
VLLSFFFGACSRYQFEFVPALALLASIGVMAMEARLGGAALRTTRLGWAIAVLATSVFGVLYGIERCSVDHDRSGVSYMMEGQVDNALKEFSISDSLSPGNGLSRLGPCLLLETENRMPEALASLQSLVRDRPEFASGHFALGNLLARLGSYADAVSQLSQALRLDPGNPAIEAALAKAQSHLRPAG